MHETYVNLLIQARDSLNAYLYDDLPPSYDDVMDLCKRIDAMLPLSPRALLVQLEAEHRASP